MLHRPLRGAGTGKGIQINGIIHVRLLEALQKEESSGPCMSAFEGAAYQASHMATAKEECCL